MKIECLYDELKEIHKIVPNPRNANKHSKDQIERLAKIIDNVGMRMPLVISKRSGFLVKGHGTLEALKFLGESHAPVSYQEFENESIEYSFMIADNEIARWAEFDIQKLKMDLPKFEDLDIDLLGIKDFELKYLDKNDDISDDDSEDENNDEQKKFLLEIELPDRDLMEKVYKDLLDQGLIVKIK